MTSRQPADMSPEEFLRYLQEFYAKLHAVPLSGGALSIDRADIELMARRYQEELSHILPKAPIEQVEKLRMEIHRERGEVRIAVQHSRENSRHVFSVEHPLPSEHLEKHSAERPHVGPLINWPFPLACSGAIYAAVPMITPIWVAAAVSVGDCEGSPTGVVSSASANPKFRTFTVPSSRTLMLAGFRSR